MSLMFQRPHTCCISCLERWCYLLVLKVLLKLWWIMMQIMLLLWGCWRNNFVYFIGLFVWCLNFMLQYKTKLDEVNDIAFHVAKITKYVYNHGDALHLMRRNTSGRKILWLVPTYFAANFIALRRILAQKDALMAMVTFRVDNFNIC